MKTKLLIITILVIACGVSFFTVFQISHDLQTYSISIDGNYIHINSEYSCATVSLERLSPDSLKQVKLQNATFFEINDTDIKDIPVLEELIQATHKIDFPTKDHSRTYVGLREFVDYEFFIMDKVISKYGGTQDDYFLKLDSDLDKRLADPNKQGFKNEFDAPQIIYHDKIYTLGDTVFWTSDEDELHQLVIRLDDSLRDNSKFIILTDDDMKHVPKIKQLIDIIGTEYDDIIASKSVKENPDWKNYRDWFKQKRLEFETDESKIHGFMYKEEYYSLSFPIC
ncbi:MAG: hypothetical protein K8Q89_00285 [Nitrosarchaeum sp.]|nr:hypothetical protein [Nitrosarchaeum sp.]